MMTRKLVGAAIVPRGLRVALACALATLAPARAQTYTETVLVNFGQPPHGASPNTGLIRDADGNLYGTTAKGGAMGQGTVYKVDRHGRQTVLYSFTGGADGAQPFWAGLISDSAGNLYGTTSGGGAYGWGTVFMLSPSGQETVLYSFTGGVDGGGPWAGLARDAAGNLYGTTQAGGGSAEQGVVFKLDTAGNETVLHNFSGSEEAEDGGRPTTPVILDAGGNIYGATSGGGYRGDGVLYKIDTSGQYTTIYSFLGSILGVPSTAPILDAAGNFYGGAWATGSKNTVGGIVYRLDTKGHFKVLHRFNGEAGGGKTNSLVRDAKGNLYGTCASGGASGDGLLFALDRTGKETKTYNFTGPDGNGPNGVVMDRAGNFYGTAAGGGPGNLGTVFEVNAAGQEKTLFGFTGAPGGTEPMAGVIQDGQGNLYGTTSAGGEANAGVIYKVDRAGHETVLHSFTGGADGTSPRASLARDAAGNLYGTTIAGGVQACPDSLDGGCGTVFKLDPAGVLSVLYRFPGGADGDTPTAGVALDSAGNLYGTTFGGGIPRYGEPQGVVYKIDVAGSFTLLHSFTGGPDGGLPQAGVVLDAEGNLYGTTYEGGSGFGVIYRIDAAGRESVLYSFSPGQGGEQPFSGVLLDQAGNLYGTTSTGGTGDLGVAYQFVAAGGEAVIYSFLDGPGGYTPSGTLALDAGGDIYGTTQLGGEACALLTGGCGVAYEITPEGEETVLHTFTGGADGGFSLSGLMLGPPDALYGTTQLGGGAAGGVLFRLAPGSGAPGAR